MECRDEIIGKHENISLIQEELDSLDKEVASEKLKELKLKNV